MDVDNIDSIINILKDTKKTKIEGEGLDSVVSSVIQKFKGRAMFGKMKYGTDLDRTDLSFLDWITHAQEEMMDGILYLEKIKKLLSKME